MTHGLNIVLQLLQFMMVVFRYCEKVTKCAVYFIKNTQDCLVCFWNPYITNIQNERKKKKPDFKQLTFIR